MSMARLHIMHAISRLDPFGPSRSVITIAENMPPACFESTICTLGRADPQVAAQLRNRGRVRLLELDTGGWLGRTIRPRVRAAIEEAAPGIVHSHSLRSHVHFPRVARTQGIGVVCTFHGTPGGAEESPKWSPKSWGGTLAEKWLTQRYLSGQTDALIAVSRDTCHRFIDGWGLTAPVVDVIPNTVDLARFDPPLSQEERAVLRNQLGATDGAVNIVTVCALQPIKGLNYLVKALARLPACGQQIRLFIAGHGDLLQPLRRLAAKLGVASTVVFLGFRDDIPQVLQAMDAFALVSLSEGLPNALLEATAAGLPAIVTSVGGMPDVVSDGETGYVVPSANVPALQAGLVRLAGLDPAARLAMGEAGRRRTLERFSVSYAARRYAELYTQLAQR